MISYWWCTHSLYLMDLFTYEHRLFCCKSSVVSKSSAVHEALSTLLATSESSFNSRLFFFFPSMQRPCSPVRNHTDPSEMQLFHCDRMGEDLLCHCLYWVFLPSYHHTTRCPKSRQETPPLPATSPDFCA